MILTNIRKWDKAILMRRISLGVALGLVWSLTVGCASQRSDAEVQAEVRASAATQKARVLESERAEGERLDTYLKEHSELKPEIVNGIKRRQLVVGMTAEDVIFVRGRPERINKNTNASGTFDQWVYWGETYLYFRNGILESWQSSE